MKIIKFLLIFLLIIFPFGQLTRIPLGISQVNIYLQDLVVGTIVTIWLVGQIRQICRRKKIFWPVLTKPIFLFFLAAGFSLLVNSFRLGQRELIVSSLYLLRWAAYAGVYFVVYDLTSLRAKRGNLKLDCFVTSFLAMTKGGLILAGVAAAIFGLLQYFLYPDLGNLSYLGWDLHRYRVFGTFFDPSFIGIILVLTIILIVDSRWASQGHPLLKPPADWRDPAIGGGLAKLGGKEVAFGMIVGFFCYLVLALTYSRASYLAYLAGMGTMAFLKKTPRFFLAVLMVGVVTIFLLPRPPGSEGVKLERENSVWGRIRNWQETLIIFKDRPPLGVGFNSYRYAQRDYGFLNSNDWEVSHAGAGADSSLLFVLATTGVIGFCIYLLLIYDILIYHIRKKSVVVLASLAALLIGSWFANSLFYPWIMLWMWVLLGFTERR